MVLNEKKKKKKEANEYSQSQSALKIIGFIRAFNVDCGACISFLLPLVRNDDLCV